MRIRSSLVFSAVVLLAAIMHARPAKGDVVWALSGSDVDAIQFAQTPSGSAQDLVNPTPGSVPFGVATNRATRDIYWSDFTSGSGSIYRRDWNSGSITSTSITGLTQGLAFDNSSGNLFWGVGGSIFRGSADLTGATQILTGLANIHSIAVDEAGGRIFFSDFSNDQIYRANVDGSGLISIVDSRAATGRTNTAPRGIAYDAASDSVFWVDSTADVLARVASDGSDYTELLSLPSLTDGTRSSANGLTIDDGRLYWAEGQSGFRGIYSAALDGSDAGLFVATSPTNSSPIGVATLTAIPEPGSIACLCALAAGLGVRNRLLKRKAAQ